MYKYWLLFVPLFMLSSIGSCSDEPDDDWSGDDDPSVVEPDDEPMGPSEDASTTIDGKEAFARFDVALLELSARPVEQPVVTLYTNLASPQIEVAQEGREQFVYVGSVSMPDESDDWRCEAQLEVLPNYLDYDNEGNPQAKPRTATLTVRAGDSQLAMLEVVQAPVPFCQLEGNVGSDFSSLSFTFTANETVADVRYYLSDRELSSGEASGILYDSNACEKLALDEGQTAFTLDFTGLLPAKSYYLYVRPLNKDGETAEDNFFQLFTAATAAPAEEQDLVLRVSANPANNFTVYLPFLNFNTNGLIDWGDGTVEEWRNSSDGLIRHTYDVTSVTTYDVRFKGTLTDLSLNSPYAPASARENTLLAIVQWGYTGLEDIDLGGFTSLSSVAADTQGAFRNMKDFGVEPYGGSFTDTGLTEIPEGFFDYATEVTSFDYTFGDCDKLVSLPADLFKNCSKVTSFQRTFINCTSLTEIPAGLFDGCGEVTTFQTTFYGCKGLKEIPARLFDTCTKVTSFEGTFGGCVGLTSLPSGLFAHNTKVRYVGMAARRDVQGGYRGGLGIFHECTGLTEIPADIFSSFAELSDASYAFYGCQGVESLPATLFAACKKLTYLENAFTNCTSLTSLPAALFDSNRQLRIISRLFSGCSALTGESPYTLLGGQKVHLYERANHVTEFVAPDDYVGCFRSCTGLSDYEEMPAHWN